MFRIYRDVRPQTQSTERTNGRDVRSIPNSSPKLSWRCGAHRCTTSHPIAARSASARCRARGVDPASCTRKVVNCGDRSALGGRGAGDGVAIAKHAGESGRGLNVVGSGRLGGALGLREARCEPFGRGLSGAAREQPATVGVGPARTVGGVLWGPRSTRTANGRGVRPLGSGTRLEPSSADRPHFEFSARMRMFVGLIVCFLLDAPPPRGAGAPMF